MAFDGSTGPCAALSKSLNIEIAKADPQNQAGVLNQGWWGIALHQDTEYKGSFYAKADSPNLGPVTVSLVSNNTGKAVATATVSEIGTDWKQYTYALKTGAMEPSASNHLVISASHAGTLWLQLVSLFPPTDPNRPNTTRTTFIE